jgi:hypothetical protein
MNFINKNKFAKYRKIKKELINDHKDYLKYFKVNLKKVNLCLVYITPNNEQRILLFV